MKKIIPFNGNFPLSHAIIHNHVYTMELSGFIGVNPVTNTLEEGIENQTTRIMETIQSTLESIGWNMSNIVKARIFLTNMDNYTKMNEVYARYFDGEYPTRFAIAVNELPRGSLVEIECTATSEFYNPI